MSILLVIIIAALVVAVKDLMDDLWDMSDDDMLITTPATNTKADGYMEAAARLHAIIYTPEDVRIHALQDSITYDDGDMRALYATALGYTE